MPGLYSKIKNWFVGGLIDQTTDLHELARINMNFHFPFIGGLLFISTSALLLVMGVDHSVIAVTISWFSALLILLLIKWTGNIRISSFILTTCIFLIGLLNLFQNHESLHLGYPYWLIIQVLFTVFNLGMWWGAFFAVLGGISFIIYRRYFLFGAAEMIQFDPEIRFVPFVIEIILATGLLVYIISVFVRTNRMAQEKLSANNALIQSQVNEKSIMLKEIHHRVKNNLQLVNSILRLQAKDLKDPVSMEAFKLSQDRIHAMALIHERLYKGDRLTEDISCEYLNSLVKDLIDLYSTGQKISVDLDQECCGFVTQKNVVPFGLILNELISNTLKHGIHTEGSISLRFQKTENVLECTYSDTGCGIPAEHTRGFGLELIESLTEQMDGSVSFTSDSDGTIFTLKIPC